MNKNSFLLIAALLYAYPSFAVKGEYADKKFELENSCKLNFTVKTNNGLQQGICSASFIGNKTFSTAEHCEKGVMLNMELIFNDEKVEAPYFTCPNSDKKYSVSKAFKMSDTKYTEVLDLAVMKVEEEVKGVAPLELPKNSEHMKTIMKDPKSCYINGYGRDNEDKSGTLRAAQVVEWDDKTAGFLGGSTQGFKLTKNFGQPGDSGGPMYCMEDGVPKLVGAISGGKIGEDYSIIELIGNGLDWIHYLKNSNEPNMQAFKNLQIVESKCGYLAECFQNLPSELAGIVKNLSANIDSLKTQLIKGENLEEKSIDEVWDLIDLEMKKNCPN